MIDQNAVSTIRVGELSPEPFSLTDNVPHEVGTELKRGTIEDLATFISAFIGSTNGVGFRAISVTDGQTLPTTTQQEFILVGKGTYYNVVGGSTIICTKELNAIVSNGSYWFIGVEIPVNVELAGITQFIRDGFINTTPSEDAVYEALTLKANVADSENIKNKQNSLAIDGTGTKYPTVDAVNAKVSNIDNTSDANKPVSTATQTALNLKSDIASPTFTGTPAAPTATTGTNTTQLATTAFVTTAVTNVVVADASTTVKGKIKLAGDLAGTADLPTVPALAFKEPTIAAGTTAQYYRGDKTFQTLDKTAVGLSNVDNTSDANKPVSTATQTALNLKENTANKNVANGYAGLGADGKLISSQLPSITISDTFVVGTQAAMLALVAETGDVAVRTDLNKSYILKGTNPTVLADWQELLTPTSAVTTVFGRAGAVTAQTGDYTTEQVTETTNKKYQTDVQALYNDATSSIQTQLNGKQPSGSYASGTGSASGTNTGDNAVNTLYSGLVTNATHTGDATGATALTVKGINGTLLSGLATGILKNTTTTGVPSIAVAADFPTLNQNTTGTASNITGVYGGTITSSQVTTGLGFTPYNAMNPSGYTSNTGTVTSVSALTLGTTGTDLSSTVATGTTTPVITLNVPTASATNRGVLSSTDWSTFNGKAPSTGGTGYIQNQNASAQSANMWISGNVTANTIKSSVEAGNYIDLYGSTSDMTFNSQYGSPNGGFKFKHSGTTIFSLNADNSATFASSVTATNFNGSATLTGTPTAPTAAPGTNTEQIATTAFVQAFDANVVHNTGAESVGGVKTFTSTPKFSTAAISINNSDNDGYGNILLNVNRFIFQDKTNATQFLTQSAGFASYKSPSILANFINTSLTATRSYSLPDISGTLALINDTALAGTPTAPTAPAGTNTEQIATTAFVQQAIRPYKVYTALLTQTGTNAPTATVLENTLGGTVVWGRSTGGVYYGTLTGAFTSNKTAIFVTNRLSTDLLRSYRGDVNTVYLENSNGDGNLLEHTIEIRVYN